MNMVENLHANHNGMQNGSLFSERMQQLFPVIQAAAGTSDQVLLIYHLYKPHQGIGILQCA